MGRYRHGHARLDPTNDEGGWHRHASA
jgi:hypothetical protein